MTLDVEKEMTFVAVVGDDDLRKAGDCWLTLVKEKEITVVAVVGDEDCERLMTAGWHWTRRNRTRPKALVHIQHTKMYVWRC